MRKKLSSVRRGHKGVLNVAKKVSLVVPCYNEQDNVVPFMEAVKTAFADLPEDYDVVFVNDGSKDETVDRLRQVHEQYPDRVSFVSFSRNFGKEAAVYAGLQHADGDFVTVIDADLQQRPEVVAEMLRVLRENPQYDAVAAYQGRRLEGKGMSAVKRLFYKMINKACEVEFHSGASDFRTLRRPVVDALLSMPEYFRFSKGLFSWVGFNTYYMEYHAEARNAGESKWTVGKLIKYAVEGFISFTTAPLRLATFVGAFFAALSLIYMIVVIIQKLTASITIPGYATPVVLILLLGGIQLMVLGIMGEYLARTYMQGKNRPIYIAREVVHCEKKEEEK